LARCFSIASIAAAPEVRILSRGQQAIADDVGRYWSLSEFGVSLAA
jgi:hypothetical protein